MPHTDATTVTGLRKANPSVTVKLGSISRTRIRKILRIFFTYVYLGGTVLYLMRPYARTHLHLDIGISRVSKHHSMSVEIISDFAN